MNRDFDDFFANLPSESFDGTDDYEAVARREARKPPASYAAVEASYVEGCRKCGGTGRFRNFGQCFACKGAGKIGYKTSPDQRAGAQARRHKATVKQQDERLAGIESFKLEQPNVWAWMVENVAKVGTPGSLDFAVSLHEGLLRYGSLTDRQLAAALDCVAKRDAKRAEKAQAAPPVAQIGIDRLKAAFDHAVATTAAKGHGLKWPRITMGGITITPAKPNSANPGALYVKIAGEYAGKVADGRFFRSGPCSVADEARVLACIADPQKAVEAYGLETGNCAICNRELTNKESLVRGIGPICSERFGWG